MRVPSAPILFLTVALLASFIVPLETVERGPTLCLFRRLTGRRCLGCGNTRAFVALSHGEVKRALRHNFLSPLLYLLCWWLAFDGWRRALARRHEVLDRPGG